MFEYIENLLRKSGFTISDLPLSADNEDEELVILEAGKDEHDEYYETTTVQHNDWCRVNRYYKDGTSTEVYER